MEGRVTRSMLLRMLKVYVSQLHTLCQLEVFSSCYLHVMLVGSMLLRMFMLVRGFFLMLPNSSCQLGPCYLGFSCQLEYIFLCYLEVMLVRYTIVMLVKYFFSCFGVTPTKSRRQHRVAPTIYIAKFHLILFEDIFQNYFIYLFSFII